MSQEALADAVGVHRPTVSNWERAVHEPTTRNLEDIASALGMSVEALQQLSTTLEANLGHPGAVRERATVPYTARGPARMPPRAYQLVYEYCSALEAAGVDEDHIEEARRLMSGETFNTLRKHMADERTEDGWLKDVKAAWVFIRDTLKAQGYDL